jgi:hypothetical protein
MAAVGEAEKRGTDPVFFLPRMSKYEHGEFSLLQKLFPTLPLVESEPSWEEVKEVNGLIPQFPLTQNTVLDGFFQTSKLFPKESSKNLPRLPDPLPSLKKAWAVHFRLGDYKILPHHQVKLAPYYAQTILTYVPKGSFLVLFSDSQDALPGIAIELEELGYTAVVWTETDTLDTFKAFSTCSLGSICSNSTFAWWCAYFTQERIDIPVGYKAYFPNVWMPGRPVPDILNLPFTQPVNLETLNASPYLKSFSYA